MGKKACDPRALEAKRLQVQLTEACKQKAVDRVLEVFDEWASAEVAMPPNCFAQTISALAACDNAGERFVHAKRIFARALADIRDWRSIGESIYTLMVRLASRAGEPLLAMEYLEQMRQPPVSIRPKLRTFIPILEACATRGLSDEAEALYKDKLITTCGPSEDSSVPPTEDEDRLWQCVFASRLRALARALREDGRGDGLRRVEVVLDDLRAVCPQLRADPGLAEALREAFTTVGWRTDQAQIGADARCPLTSTVLRATHCSEEDFRSLLSLVERLAIEDTSARSLEGWQDFKAWLARSRCQWDTVIDGANVGHYAQGAFSHAQIGKVIEQCNRAGRRCVALVLRERWLQPELDFSLPTSKKKRRRLPQLGRQEVAIVDNQDPEAPGDLALAADGAMAVEGCAAAVADNGSSVLAADGAMAVDGCAAAVADNGSSVLAADGAMAVDGCAAAVDNGVAADEAAEAQPPAAEPSEVTLAFDEELSEAQRQVACLAEDWRRRGLLVVSPPSIDDDWVSLYLAVAMCLRGVADVQLVTNDEFRDHFWRMRQPAAFRTWRERHLTRYHVLCDRPEPGESEDGEVRPCRVQSAQLFPPPVYSTCVQRSPDGRCWHFPLRASGEQGALGEEARSGLQWLAAWDPRAGVS